ncbi:MAG: chromosome partitioning protein [Actinomycetota bacterium]|jgi:chromosome partitioning protein|nr:chromosome partitioning protein [Actinomycetota bacterium]
MEMTTIHKWQILARRGVPAGGWFVCVANQKGGVGKTTTTLNLAAALALRDRKVLVVDVDPQANATTGLGLDHRAPGRSTYDLLLQESTLEEVIQPTAVAGVDCAPASVDLAGAEIELVTALAREHRLKEALVDVGSRFDVVLLDCPPSLGLLTINAMVAARDLIVPVQCEYYALEGLGQLLGNAERVRKSLNPALRIAGILLTMFDGRTNLSPEVAQEVRKHFGAVVYETVIPRSIRLSEAPSFGEPAVTLDPSSRGARSYLSLAGEILSRAGTDQESGAVDAVERSPESPSPAIASNPGDRTSGNPAVPGPGGRGYGVATALPRQVEASWPPLEPWTGTA